MRGNYESAKYRGVSQLADGMLWEHEAAGSSPATSTSGGREQMSASPSVK